MLQTGVPQRTEDVIYMREGIGYAAKDADFSHAAQPQHGPVATDLGVDPGPLAYGPAAMAIRRRHSILRFPAGEEASQTITPEHI